MGLTGNFTHNMSIFNKDYGLQVSQGLVSGTTAFSKFGRNGAVSTTSVPICMAGVYSTPTAATALELLSSSASDTSAGSGAREVTVIGLDSNWAEVTQTVVTNGTTPVALATNLIRLYRAYVSSSGTYGTQSAGSHVGTITIRSVSGATTWATIDVVNSFPQGQTLIGAYTVPAGYTLYLNEWSISVDSTKPATVEFFTRANADDVTSPYSGTIRVRKTWENIANIIQESESVFMKLDAKTDCGFIGFVSATTASVSVNFSGYLIAN